MYMESKVKGKIPCFGGENALVFYKGLKFPPFFPLNEVAEKCGFN